MTDNLPKTFVDKRRSEFKDVRFFGMPITQLDKDELMAIICCLGRDQQQRERQRQYDVDFRAALCTALCTANRLKNRSLVAQLLQRCREIWGNQKEKQ